jgi:hypothetical protein
MLSDSQNKLFMHADVSRNQLCRYMKMGQTIGPRESIDPSFRFLRAPTRRIGSIRAANSTAGVVGVEALQEAASDLIQTPEKYFAALRKSSKKDREIDAEWEKLSAHSETTGDTTSVTEVATVRQGRVGETMLTEVPSVRDFCSKMLSDCKSEPTAIGTTYRSRPSSPDYSSEVLFLPFDETN